MAGVDKRDDFGTALRCSSRWHYRWSPGSCPCCGSGYKVPASIKIAEAREARERREATT